jgi:hypothetical protein
VILDADRLRGRAFGLLTGFSPGRQGEIHLLRCVAEELPRRGCLLADHRACLGQIGRAFDHVPA